MKHKVSIIVPVYNVEAYLRKCLDSLIRQTLDNIEIIIVNDGTKDNSQLIIDEYVNKYPNLIKSFIKENGGQSSARNFGIKEANGEYIGFVDSDDYIKENMFELLYNKAKEKDSDIVICDTIMVDDKKEYILKTNLKYSDDVIKNYIISYPMPCIRLFKIELFKDNYLFPLNTLYEDLNLMPLFAILTSNIVFLEEPLYYYYKRTNSTMNAVKITNKHMDIFSVLDSVRDHFKEADLFEKYKDEIEYLYITHLLRSASLRFIVADNYKELLNRIHIVIDNNFKNWNKNKYLKKSSYKLRLICFLAYHKQYKLLKLILKINGGM